MPKSTLLVGGKECYVAADDNTATDHASNKIKEVHMMHAWELFGMSGTNWVYVGERDYNGLPAYVWNSQRNSTMGAASVMVTTEVYWLHVSDESSRRNIWVTVSVVRLGVGADLKKRNGLQTLFY